MRNVPLFTMLAIVFACLPYPVVQADEAAERPWSAGYAEADITPAPGQCMMEGFGSERYAKGALAPLLTQVVALRDRGDHTGVLISADVGCFDRVMVEVIRRAITRKHGIPAKNVMLVASHTHWGPAVSLHPNFSCGAPNVWYMGSMEDKILANVDTALENLSPAVVEYGLDRLADHRLLSPASP